MHRVNRAGGKPVWPSSPERGPMCSHIQESRFPATCCVTMTTVRVRDRSDSKTKLQLIVQSSCAILRAEVARLVQRNVWLQVVTATATRVCLLCFRAQLNLPSSSGVHCLVRIIWCGCYFSGNVVAVHRNSVADPQCVSIAALAWGAPCVHNVLRHAVDLWPDSLSPE